MRHLDYIKYDPIEDTDEYKAIVNEIENMVLERFPIEKYPKRGTGKRRWYYKQRLLKERGIDWKTPMELNPLVSFE